MSAIMFFAVVGLGVGGIYALLACGLVTVYKATGVVNFALGAVATYVSFEVSSLRSDGSIKLPLPTFVPHEIQWPGGPAPLVPAVVVGLATGMLLMVIVQLLVFRPLRDATPLARVVGAVGVLIYLQGVIVLQYGTQPRSPEPVFPADRIRNFLGTGRSLPQDRLWVALLAIVVSLGLAVFYRRTHIGLTTRALAENETGGQLLGYSPHRAATLTAAIAGLIAGMVGVFGSPLAGVDPSKFTLLLVPALSAALLARFSSTIIAAVFALLLGAFEGLVAHLATANWFPHGLQLGITQVLPLLVILVALYCRTDAMPGRGAFVERPLPAVPVPKRLPWFVGGFLIIGLIVAQRCTGPWSVALTTSIIGIVLMLSLVVLVGYVGQLSLAQLAIAGIAAYSLMRLMSNGRPASQASVVVVSGPGLPFVLAAVIAVLLGVMAGVIAGLPALRIRGVQLVVATIALAFVVQEFVLQSPTIVGEGAGQSSPVPRAQVGGLDLASLNRQSGLSDRYPFAVFALLTTAVLMYIVGRLRTSDFGRELLAVRSNERAAAAAGVDVTRAKIRAIALSSAVAAVGGVLIAMNSAVLQSDQFGFFPGLLILAFAFIGGITSIGGAVLGGLILGGGLIDYFIRLHVPGYVQYGAVLGGFLLTLNAVLNPAGVASSLRSTVLEVRTRTRGGRSARAVR